LDAPGCLGVCMTSPPGGGEKIIVVDGDGPLHMLGAPEGV
jgi:hypothetical protein